MKTGGRITGSNSHPRKEVTTLSNTQRRESFAEATQIPEEVMIFSEDVDRFSRQINHAISLKKKISILEEEMKHSQKKLKEKKNKLMSSFKQFSESDYFQENYSEISKSDIAAIHQLMKACESFTENLRLLQSFEIGI